MGNCCCQLEIAALQDSLNTVKTQIGPFLSGHPILILTDQDDIDQFDNNGNGTGDWIGWAFADGAAHFGYTTTDLRDKFVVGSGLSYNLGDTGGANTVTLTTAEIPVHTHTLTDPGHTHTLTDPGHTHAVTDAGHDHSATQVGHSHNGTTSTDGSHTHVLTSNAGNGIVSSDNQGLYLDGTSGASEVSDADSLAANGDHDHTITTDSQTPAVTVNDAFTGISVDSAFTGATAASSTTGMTIGNTGSGDAHENRPPYWAVVFIQKCA
jgi:microcystin-dependent protein